MMPRVILRCGRFSCEPLRLLLSALVLLVLFRVPRTLLGVPPFYTVSYVARTLGDQTETYSITFVEAAAVLIAAVLYGCLRERKTRYRLLLGLVALTNVLRFLLRWSNPFDCGSYEIFLTLLVAFSCGTIVEYCCPTAAALERFADCLIALLFLFQLGFVAIGKGKNGSYGSLGVSGGGAAVCYATYVLWKVTGERGGARRAILILCALTGLLLSGSRTQLLLLCAFLAVYVLVLMPAASGRKWLLIGGGAVAAFALIVGQNAVFSLFSGSRKLSGLMNIFSTGVVAYVTGDASANERFQTWLAALQLIRENPLGISCAVIDLQTRMFRAGATTFPHSTLLAYYLLLGVPAAVMYGAFWRRLCLLLRQHAGQALLLAYVVLLLTFYGGISVSYISIFWLFALFSYSGRALQAGESR